MSPRKTTGQRTSVGNSNPAWTNAKEVCPTYGMQTHNNICTSNPNARTGVLQAPFSLPHVPRIGTTRVHPLLGEVSNIEFRQTI